MRIRHTYLTAMLAAASAALASTLAAAPPAAADCVDGGGPHPLTLCSQGEVRTSNRALLPGGHSLCPLSCDVDWMCDRGLSIALDD